MAVDSEYYIFKLLFQQSLMLYILFLKKGYKPDLTFAECALNRSNIGMRNAAVFPEPNGTDYIKDLAKMTTCCKQTVNTFRKMATWLQTSSFQHIRPLLVNFGTFAMRCWILKKKEAAIREKQITVAKKNTCIQD